MINRAAARSGGEIKVGETMLANISGEPRGRGDGRCCL